MPWVARDFSLSVWITYVQCRSYHIGEAGDCLGRQNFRGGKIGVRFIFVAGKFFRMVLLWDCQNSGCNKYLEFYAILKKINIFSQIAFSGSHKGCYVSMKKFRPRSLYDVLRERPLNIYQPQPLAVLGFFWWGPNVYLCLWHKNRRCLRHHAPSRQKIIAWINIRRKGGPLETTAIF